MNRNTLKAYAPQARRDFIKAVTDRAAYYGLTKDKTEPITEQGDVAIIVGKPFPRSVAAKRKRLEERIRRQGFEQVMEAMAYTWFNRFVAIRFMELHGYLGHGYRVLSHPEGSAIPEIVEHAQHVDLPGIDREKVIELKLEGTKEAELYRMLLIAQCNALHKAMPFLFEWIGDATELLLPENLLHSDSLIRKLVDEIPEEEWLEVEIIGWLYQFYISEKKGEVIGKVVKSEDIPAATQLFTPNWIVKYMVQNTLGRQWVATYPDSPIKQQMEYYIDPAEQTHEVQEQLNAIIPENLNPEELTLFDPACGSGHILVEAYDLLKAIYLERGYRAKDIPRLILKKNLFGLEIDDRAAQLAAFALMMKARADDRRIFDNGAKPHVMAIQNSPDLSDDALQVFTTNYTDSTDKDENAASVSIRDIRGLLELFEHGKTRGSLIRVPEKLGEKLPGIRERVEDVLAHGDMFGKAAAGPMIPVVEQAWVLAGNYDASVTNPPYMGSGGMNPQLKLFAKNRFPDSKADLFAMFIERNLDFVGKQSVIGMITMQSWMFLSSFDKLRAKLLDQHTILSMAHLGPRAFDSIGGEVVSTTAFVIRNGRQPEYNGTYVRLVDGNSESDKDNSLRVAIKNPNCSWFYRASSANFKKIPGSPIAYWIGEMITGIFDRELSMAENKDIFAAVGLFTCNNDLFMRGWHEISLSYFEKEASSDKLFHAKKWVPYNKGGSYRKWYGNLEFAVNYYDKGKLIREYRKNSGQSYSLPGEDNYFKEGITWTDLTSGKLSARYLPQGCIYDVSGHSSTFSTSEELYKIIGYLNTKFIEAVSKIINTTFHFQIGDFKKLPYPSRLSSSQNGITSRLVFIGKFDWDSYEKSWDFTQVPLLQRAGFGNERLDEANLTPNPYALTSKVSETYANLRERWKKMMLEMQQLEEKNNRIFIEAYDLQDELTPDVPLSEITLTCNPHYRYGGGKSDEELEELLLADTMKELVSYAMGCMLGRYSLDKPGLIYAHSGNVDFDPSQYRTLPADQDGIIPITDTDWFADDAGNRFIEFMTVAWPREHLEENLTFIAESLCSNRAESHRETIRRYLAAGFYKHHLAMYKRRPIYWLFSSGKQRAFQCLVYLHRYNEGTLSRMRTEYVIPLQGKINARIEQLKNDIHAATSTPHRKKLEKECAKLVKQQAELQTFDEKLRHYADKRISLDLDDGVKVNYGKFGDLLAEVKAVTGKQKD